MITRFDHHSHILLVKKQPFANLLVLTNAGCSVSVARSRVVTCPVLFRAFTLWRHCLNCDIKPRSCVGSRELGSPPDRGSGRQAERGRKWLPLSGAHMAPLVNARINSLKLRLWNVPGRKPLCISGLLLYLSLSLSTSTHPYFFALSLYLYLSLSVCLCVCNR